MVEISTILESVQFLRLKRLRFCNTSEVGQIGIREGKDYAHKYIRINIQ